MDYKKAMIILLFAGLPIVLTVILLIGPCVISLILLFFKNF
jgi:hypothetical protein